MLLRVAAFLSSGLIRFPQLPRPGYNHGLGGRLGRGLAELRIQGRTYLVRLWKPCSRLRSEFGILDTPQSVDASSIWSFPILI